MVQVDLPGALAIGQICALLSKNYLKKEPDKFKNKLLGPFNLYLSCGYSLAGMFLLIGWPSWEVMYTTQWMENPFNRPLTAGFYILFLVCMILLGNLGFILGHHWYLKGKDRRVVYGAIVGIILTILPFILRWGVWFKVGLYDEVKAGGGASFFDPPFFCGWLAIMGWLAVSTLAMGIWLKKTSDKFA